MAVTVQAGRWLHVSKSKTKVRKRRVQAHDLLAAMSVPAELGRQSPRAPKPRFMIETMEVVGDNVLTAQDHALYEVLLAWARTKGLDKDIHEVPAEAVRTYLGVDKWDEVRRSADRLSSVQVRYDFRDEEWRRHGKIALVSVGLKESLKDPAARFVEFEIPARIRRVMAEARDYAQLELAAFPRFNCKYTAILYQRLALRAGYDKPLIRPWEIEPTKLATDLGYPIRGGKLAFAEFRKRCLDPVLADMAYAVTRFEVRLEEVRGTGRGHPVEKLVWHVTAARKFVLEHSLAPIAEAELEMIRAKDHTHSASSMPTSNTVRRVVQYLNRALTVRELVEGWRAALDEVADGEPAEGVPVPVPYVDVAGERLADQLRRLGPETAFANWAVGNAKTRRLMVRQPPKAEREKAAAVAEAAAQAMARATDGDFEASTDIVVRLDPDADVSPTVSFLTKLGWQRGGKLVTVEVERPAGLISNSFGYARPTDQDLAALHALPGIQSVRFVVVEREMPAEESREAKTARWRVESADVMLASLAKDIHPRLVLDMTDVDMSPWTACYASLPNGGAQFKAALRIMDPPLRRAIREDRFVQSSDVLRHTKATLANLAKAAKSGDFEEISKISRGIHATARSAA